MLYRFNMQLFDIHILQKRTLRQSNFTQVFYLTAPIVHFSKGLGGQVALIQQKLDIIVPLIA